MTGWASAIRDPPGSTQWVPNRGLDRARSGANGGGERGRGHQDGCGVQEPEDEDGPDAEDDQPGGGPEKCGAAEASGAAVSAGGRPADRPDRTVGSDTESTSSAGRATS